jgi:hypothetical protein
MAMANSISYLGGLGQATASDLTLRSPSRGPSEGAYGGSQEALLPRYAAGNNPARTLGDSVPYAPRRRQEVIAENPTHSTNRPLGEYV